MASQAASSSGQERGLALIEAIVATGLLATTLAAGAHLVVAGGRAAADGAVEASGRVLALDKLEQLRALGFSTATDGQAVRDVSADTAADPPSPAGGAGLTASPDGTLESDVDGYVDYLAQDSRLVASPADAVVTRRWAVVPIGGGALRIDVCVVRRGIDSVRGGAWREGAGAVCVTAVRVRGVE